MSEHRIEKRHHLIIDLKLKSGKSKLDAKSSNISKGGLQLVCRNQISVGSLVKVSPVKMNLKYPWELLVLWITPIVNTDLFLLGGKFSTKISENDIISILQICSS